MTWSACCIKVKASLCDFRGYPFGGTLIFNLILRGFGYQIGTFSNENDVPVDSLPEMLSIGHEVFTTAGYFCRPTTHLPEHIITEHIHIGDHSLVGNVAVLQPGIMKDNMLLGVMTRSGPSENVQLPNPSSVEQEVNLTASSLAIRFGRPASIVPPRPACSHVRRPSVSVFIGRLLCESSLFFMSVPRFLLNFLSLRFFFHSPGLPIAPDPANLGTSGLKLAVIVAISMTTTEVFMLIYIVCLKWALLGKVPSGYRQNLWEPFVRRWQMSYSTLGSYFQVCPIVPEWAGYNVLARLVGCNIGHKVVGVNSLCFIDPDMWNIEGPSPNPHLNPIRDDVLLTRLRWQMRSC